ncbi:MAG TPA: GNAT family N-acetyltransferase [Gemmatimonadaceae bacterium]|jgi:diamine N-acetyltransferase|nr:GNAT family N-acetyltransferase [Gemmatimonadaceae bacterium]
MEETANTITGLVIRRARVADAAPLAEFAARTFTDTFGPDNRPEDMAMFLASTFTPDHQTREITDPAYATLLAEIDGDLAGYAQLRLSTPPDCVTGPSPIELLRFYVDTAWKGRGIAQRLMAEVREAAKRLGARTLWLGVWEHNPRAQAFYAKSGYEDVGSHDFVLGTDVQTDRILTISL